jgi:hypothetical protein
MTIPEARKTETGANTGLAAIIAADLDAEYAVQLDQALDRELGYADGGTGPQFTGLMPAGTRTADEAEASVRDFFAFCGARLDEEAAMAEGAGDEGDRRWSIVGEGLQGLIETAHRKYIVVYDEGSPDEAQAEHIAYHDPERGLLGVAADRAILAMAERQPGSDLPDSVTDGRDPGERDRDEAIRDMLLEVMRHRATRWNDHPEYRSGEWAPS